MKAVYIHIPFCASICTYCDFCKFYYHVPWVKPYLEALKQEITLNYQNELVTTLYVGGGTPSVLSLEELQDLFQVIQCLSLESCQEFTFECNIENITEEKALFLYQNGVNRISLGVETFHEKYLSFLNRHHSPTEVKEKIAMLKRIGFTNINVDLIYALPGQTLEEIMEDVALFLALDIPHISMYSLMIEPNTILGIHHTEAIDEDMDAMMYARITQLLQQNGYTHYEISNFSKPGYASKHNLVYWNNLEYYGFGVGASGYVNGVRYQNTRNIEKYLKGIVREEEVLLSKQDQMEDEFMLGLRKIEGVSKSGFLKKYQLSVEHISIIKRLLYEGKLKQNHEYIYIPEKDLYVSNRVLSELIGCEEDEWNCTSG